MRLFRKPKPAADAAPIAAVSIQNVERSFGSGDSTVRVLRGVNLDVMPGKLVALYGPSGSGKTTLLNLIGALDQPTAGKIFLDGKDITRMSEAARARLRRTQMGFIFQSYALIPTYSAMENIDLALRLPKLGLRQRRQRSQAALEAVGLSAWASHVPDELSGGQRQRIAIARALALQPKLILADEPTSALDTRTARRVLALFRGIAEGQGTTFIIVSHDPMVAEHVDLAYDLHDGITVPHAADVLVMKHPHDPTPPNAVIDTATDTATETTNDTIIINTQDAAKDVVKDTVNDSDKGEFKDDSKLASTEGETVH